ncbi:hypothetical protein ACRALDRAFT_2051577 [Sodiomyces alcalophilus JCM 7366]|uniref:uncharacterized protein n=1 Tax=Sodiomyces alcalophilus JCM 7366 TaxID=591952 RepID=UPI0039B47DA6
MAFIEPRLIHLLNDSTTPHLAHTELLNPWAEGTSEPADRPFPVEPTANHSEDLARISTCPGPGGHAAPPGVPPPGPGGGVDDDRRIDTSPSDRNIITAVPRIPLRLLLGEPDTTDKIIDEAPQHAPESQDDMASKKRHRTAAAKEDLLHLPQPVKKQKASPQGLLPPMPPIINGLHEPPPNAALFPPIAPNDFDGSDAGQRTTTRDYPRRRHGEPHARTSTTKAALSPKPAERPQTNTEQKKGPVKTRQKAKKPRRKWSEEETRHLLLGVDRHGVGKWTDILADPDFQFNGRNAGDLKDRFRTCCPHELRKSFRDKNASLPADDAASAPTGEPKSKPKTGLLSENILIDTDAPCNSGPVPSRPDDGEAEAEPKSKRSRAHRKNMEDLAELGIHGPFKKSHRRERRPFSEEDDRLILEGLYKYGPAWTKIQRDPQFRLAGRQPTDLRDRVRNKYRDVYVQVEKGLLQAKDPGDNKTLEPAIRMAISSTLPSTKPLPMDHLPTQPGSRDDSSFWPLSVLANGETPRTSSHLLAASQFLDSSYHAPSALLGNAGEMDISRLLLDDTKIFPQGP